jgi:[protein-PII] uridylyltransferase
MSAVIDKLLAAATPDQALAAGEKPVKAFRSAIKQLQEQLKALFDEGVEVEVLVRGRTTVIDHILKKAWNSYFGANDFDLALIAVGGYGRGELHPGSDIDLMVLLRDSHTDGHRETIEQLVMFLWDIGLEIGHSVRTLGDCVQEAERDITVATNLMEARLLNGPQDLFDAMRDMTAPPRLWPSREFFEAKWQEQIRRHHKFHDTAYNLEPNIKEGPGGLRDIQMIGWVAKRHFNANTLHDLVKHGFLTEREYAQLIEGQTFLWQIRFALHIAASRREDRLLFDYQRALADRFGYADARTELAVEQFMKRYYRTVAELNRLNEMLLQLFQEAILYADDPAQPIPLNRRFQIRKGFIEVTHSQVFRRYRFALLEIFLLMQQNPEIKGIRASTIRLIRDHRYLIDENFRKDIRNRSLFMEIMRQPTGLTHQLRRMNRYGILANYIPAFGKISGLMQYDLFHVYTVDEHTLMVVRNLRRLTVAEHTHELPFCSDLIKTIPKTEILYLGALFHDIAKGRGGDHSAMGADDAYEFCILHGLSNHDARFVAWLVRNHLIMSSTAQRKDISDPDVILEFATTVGDQTHLDYIYLLTIADVRGTNPSLWNAWKDSLLLELYISTKRTLARGLTNPIDQAEHIAEIQKLVRDYLVEIGISGDAIAQLWKHLGDDYFLRHSAEEIAWQTQSVIHNAGQEMPLVLVQQETERGGTEIFIHAPLAKHLFAATTQTLDQMGLTVVDAKIIHSSDGYTFDTYVVLEASGETIRSELRIQEILDQLRHELRDLNWSTKKPTRRLARQLRHFRTPTQVSYIQDTRKQRTVMELVTADRPGLLSRIGRALMECDIYLQNAKIATIGEKVEDVFFISDRENRPILDEVKLGQLRERIISYLDASD